MSSAFAGGGSEPRFFKWLLPHLGANGDPELIAEPGGLPHLRC